MSYDAIVIGAGHNGLILAYYLQRAGLKTLVVEGSSTVGGMTRTEEPALAGYKHNPHANLLVYLDLMPMTRDLRLAKFGFETVCPPVQHGTVFADGRPALVLHRPDLLDLTRKNITQHSKRDAELYVELQRAVQGLAALLQRGLFRPPDYAWAAEHAHRTGEIFHRISGGAQLGLKSAREVIDVLFESDEMRTCLYQAAVEFGAGLDQTGSGLAFLGVTLWGLGRWRIPIGGMQTFVNALAAAAKEVGVTISTGSAVQRISVNRGRVQGVVVAGDEIRARRLIASSAGLVHTLVDLVGQENLSEAERARASSYQAVSQPVMVSVLFCLKQAPAYPSTNGGDINRCLHVTFGADTAQAVLKEHRSVGAGVLPIPAAGVVVNSLFDSSQAPIGRHVATANSLFPAHVNEDDWTLVRSSYPKELLDRWHDYAPNMTAVNVIAHYLSPPKARDDKVSLMPGPKQYRSDVEGMYFCGSAMHPGGGAHGACGYNAFRMISEDLGLASRASNLG